MSQNLKTAVAVIGIDIGKNTFHVIGLDGRGAIVLRQKWSGQIERSDTELLDQLSRFDADSWVDAVNVEAGPWALHLAGTAVPKPQLGVSLLGNQLRTPSVDPFLTLVRPGEGFETVNLDSSGSGKVALPDGESVMLLQGDEVWEVRLSFNDGRGRTQWTP